MAGQHAAEPQTIARASARHMALTYGKHRLPATQEQFPEGGADILSYEGDNTVRALRIMPEGTFKEPRVQVDSPHKPGYVRYLNFEQYDRLTRLI